MSIRTFVGLFDCKLVELLTGVFYWLDYCVKLVVVLGGVGICAVDFVLKFFVEKIEEGVVLKELEKIAKNYVSSFNFLIDFIALFPFPEIIQL